MPTNIPIVLISNAKCSSSTKYVDGFKLVSDIIFDDMKRMGALTNVHATMLVAMRSTSVSYLVAMTYVAGAVNIVWASDKEKIRLQSFKMASADNLVE